MFLQRAIREYGLSARPAHDNPDTAMTPLSASAEPGMLHRRQVKEVILLLKAAPGSKWFDAVFDWPHCFLHGRVDFVPGSGASGGGASNPHGSVVVYMGAHVDTFCSVFKDAGRIAGCNSWFATG